MSHALEGIRVIETEGLATAYCGRLLASLGAHVSKLEPSSGDPSRRFLSQAERERVRSSSAHWYNNLGKRITRCDLDTPAGMQGLETALESADVFLTAYQPQKLAELGLDLESLSMRHPRLVVTVITPFGATGPHRDLAATDMTVLASGGQLYLTGYPDRRPVQYACFQGYKQGSIHGAYGTLIALVERMDSGRGQVVDVSVQECVANALQTTMQMYDLTGEVRKRVGSRLADCADGYVRNMGLARGWQALTQWLEEEGYEHDFTRRIREMDPSDRPSQELMAQLETALRALLASMTKREIFEQALNRRIALTPVNTAEEVLAMPELEERSFWASATDSETGELIKVPRGPFTIEPSGLVPPSEAKVAEEPTKESPASTDPRSDGARGATPTLPLAGLVVADFTWFGAGAMATRVLAHFGATVVKIESSQRIDGIRLAPPFRDEPGINKSGFFNNFNSGKRSITLDMHTKGGLAVAEKLIGVADFVADNFSPGVLESFGLSDKRVHELNPRTVILHMPMGGTYGELRKALGFGATIEAVSGLVHLMGDPDRPPVGTEVNYPDYGSNPYHAASALLAGLIAVRRTGLGQVIELAQVESTVAFVGEALVEAQRTGQSPGRHGNVSPECVFNEVVPCGGEDQWCAISCRSPEELHRLLTLAGLGDAVLDEYSPLDTADNHRALAERLGLWTAGKDKYELAAVLQDNQIPAYAVVDARDLLERDPQIKARNHYVVLDHPEAGRITFDGPSVRLSRTPGRVPSPAPCLGQHTEQVLKEMLGMTSGEIDALAEAGALV